MAMVWGRDDCNLSGILISLTIMGRKARVFHSNRLIKRSVFGRRTSDGENKEHWEQSLKLGKLGIVPIETRDLI